MTESGPVEVEDRATAGDATFKLRPRPRPVTRFHRRRLMLLAGLAAALVCAAMLAALHPPRLDEPRQRELYQIGRNAVAEGIAGLPEDYGQIRQAVPQPAVRDGTAEPAAAAAAARPSPGGAGRGTGAAEAGQAERERRARQALLAREAGLLFVLAARPAAAAGMAGRQAPPAPPPPTSTLAAAPADAPAAPDGDQQHKLAFLDGRDAVTTGNPHRLQAPVSPYQVLAGSIIAAALVTGINSDLPGMVKAQVTEPVYDTVTGQHLLIPPGSQLIGRYDSLIAHGQSRVLVIWQRLILPDGSSLVLDALPASDTAGYAGLKDSVDYHARRLVAGVALATLLGVGTELSLGDEESEIVRAIRQSAQQNTNRAGQRITERNLTIQPTITIRPGWPLRVLVHRDLILQPWRG